MRKTRLFPALLMAAAGLAAAAPATAGERGGDKEAFARGARVWSENCTRCHNLRDPREFRDDQWRPIIAHMRVRGGLTGAEARDVLTFMQNAN